MEITGRYARDVRRAKKICVLAISLLICVGTGALYANVNRSVENRGIRLKKSNTVPPGTKKPAVAQDLSYVKAQRKVALVIGINDYSTNNHEGAPIPDLEGAVHDAKNMAEFLEEQGYEPIIVMTDESSPELHPTRKNIIEAFSNLSKGEGFERFAFYFAGHGYRGEGYESNIIPFSGGEDVWISLHKIVGELDKIDKAFQRRRTKRQLHDVLIIVDACNIGEPKSSNQQIMKQSSLNWWWAVASSENLTVKDSRAGGLFTQTLRRNYTTYAKEGSLIDDNEIEVLKQEQVLIDAKQVPVIETRRREGLNPGDFIVFTVPEKTK